MYWDPNGFVDKAFELLVCPNSNGDPKALVDEAAQKTKNKQYNHYVDHEINHTEKEHKIKQVYRIL